MSRFVYFMFAFMMAILPFSAKVMAQSSQYSYYYPYDGKNGCTNCKPVMDKPCRWYSDTVYVAGRIGATRDSQRTAFNGDTDHALTYGGAIGYNLPRSFVRLEAEAMFHEMEYGTKNEADVWTAFGNIYLDYYPRCSRFVPFVFGGMGVISIDGDNGKDDFWAYQAGAGLSYRIARPVAAEVRYAYQGLVEKEDRKSNIYGYHHSHQLTAGLRFYF